MTSNVRSGELDDFLRKFPETHFMDVFAPDINGILHGKRIQADEFPKVFGNGSNFVASTPLLNVLSEYAPGQFEINLNHIDDPILACDHAVLLKRAV